MKAQELKKQIKELELKNTEDLIFQLSLDYEETTIGRNGYPQNIKKVIVADTISELLELKQVFEECGFEVNELELYKKNGWNLWNRSSNYIELGKYMTPDENDTYIDIDMSNTEELKDEILTLFYGDDEGERRERAIEQLEKEFNEEFDLIEDNQEELKAIYEEWNNEVQFFIDQLPEEGKHRVFVDPSNDFGIEYIVNEESTFYGFDTLNYKLAISVEALTGDEEY